MATGWNPSDLQSVTVSGTGNVVATFPGGGSVRSVTSHSSGKWYFECKVTFSTISTFSAILGIASSAFSIFGRPGQTGGATTDSVGDFMGNAQEIYYNSSQQQFNLPGGGVTFIPISSGDVISICVDMDNHLFYYLSPAYIAGYGANGWNGLTTANPASQVGGISFSLSTAAFIIGNDGDPPTTVMTLNTGGSAFARSPPAGFNAWDVWGNVQSGSAFLSGSGGFSASARLRAQAKATLSGAGLFTATIGPQTYLASGSFAGSGGFFYLRGTANLVTAPSSTDTGTGTLAGSVASLLGTGGSVDAGTAFLTLPSIQANTTLLQNALVDSFLRGQSFAPPATWYVALVTALGSPTTGGLEVTGSGYARVAIGASLANWSGTQGAGTTTVSTGTTGQSTNNVIIQFAGATANWGTIIGYELWDSPTAGNRWLAGKLPTALTINNGDPARAFQIGAMSISIG